MKTLKRKQLSFSTKQITKGFAAVMVMFAVASCGNKSSSNNPVPVTTTVIANNSFAICSSCVTSIPTPLTIDQFNAKNPSGQASFVNMQLIVNGTGFVPGTSSSYNLYSGPVVIQGQFVAANTLVDPMNRSCTIPAGTYSMQTTAVGAMSAGILQIPELVSVSGNIRMKIMQGILYKDMMTQTTRMFGSVYVTSANGAACSMSFSDSFN